MNQDSRAQFWDVRIRFSLVCLLIVLSVASVMAILIFLTIEATDRAIKSYVLPILIEDEPGFLVDKRTDAS